MCALNVHIDYKCKLNYTLDLQK